MYMGNLGMQHDKFVLLFTSNSSTDDNDAVTSTMDTNVDSHCNHCEYDTESDDGPLVVDQLPVNTSTTELLSDDVVDEDDIGVVIMDVFSVDEGENVIIATSARMKQNLKEMKHHAVSSLRVLLSLLK